MSLASHVQALIGSEPFERLLTSRARPDRGAGGDGRCLRACRPGDRAGAADPRRGPGPHEAEALVADVEAFLPGGAALLPAWEALPYELISPTPEIAARRAAAIRRLRAPDGPLVVVAPRAGRPAGDRPDARAGRARSELEQGGEAAPDELAERLVELGYHRVDVVEHRGEFAVRGGVLDVFPAEQRRPMRLEFWGDEIDSIRRVRPLHAALGGRGRCRRARPGARADPG